LASGGHNLEKTLAKGGTTYVTGTSVTVEVNLQVGSNVATDFAFTGTSIKQITDCATTGSLLLASRGGSRGYGYKHASFDPNKEFTYKILYAGDI